MKLQHILTISALLLGLLSCATNKNSYLDIQDQKAREIIEKSIEAYGGLDNWNNKNQLSFKKWFILYDAEGKEEINVHQKHSYSTEKIYMSWMDGNDKIEQTKVGKKYQKSRNGKLDESATQTSIQNSVLAATFVMNFPYNLLDKGSSISYDGHTTFEGKEVDIIRVEYFPETQKHHTTKDIWWHYIDKKTYIGLGYKVKHKDHISLVKNTSFHTFNGFTLPWKRASYRVDEDGNELFLRATYEYTDYSE